MAKKKDEKDVLVVRDEKTGEISVVAGLNADDTPKRTPAKAENAQSFLQFDRHGDVLDNFFKNFFRQCKEPSRFGFYRIAADQVDSMLGVMKDLLQHPYQNKQILAPHKIDTFPYQQQVQEEMAAQKTEKQEPQKQENMEQQKEQQESPQQTQGRQGYQPINESKINWQELEDRWGVKRDDLEKSGDLTKMLHYGKSDLVKVKPTFGSGTGAIAAWEANMRLIEDGRFGSHLMKLMVSQNAPFVPMYNAWREDSRDMLHYDDDKARRDVEIIDAKVLSNRKPPYSIAGGLYDALKATDGEMFALTNAHARKARRL